MAAGHRTGRFGVDDHPRDAVVAGQLPSDLHRLRAGGSRDPALQADIAAPVGDHDHQGPQRRVAQQGAPQQLRDPHQARGQGGAAPNRQLPQPPLRRLDGGGRLHQHLRAGAAEADQRHLVAFDVGVQQQAQDRALAGCHPAPRPHRAGGVHAQHHQRPGLPDPHLATPVAGLDDHRQIAARIAQLGGAPAAAALVHRARAQRRVQGQVHRLRRRPGADVAAPRVVADGERATADVATVNGGMSGDGSEQYD